MDLHNLEKIKKEIKNLTQNRRRKISSLSEKICKGLTL
jgi:hypothetical protein